MTDNSFAGPMSMVKIDGSKIKLLREQQGLTQLYLATAVEVTTDTISRWENKRYPSIKKENGLKLATALNVTLEELLEEAKNEEQTGPATDQKLSQTVAEPEPASHTSVKNQPSEKTESFSSNVKTPHFFGAFRKNWPLLILSVTLFTVFIAFGWYFLQSQPSQQLTIKRILPAHCVAGQPFPVLIKISGTPNGATALIIKEQIPVQSTIHSSAPKISSRALRNGSIKWLEKIEKDALFSYMISLPAKQVGHAQFAGSGSISGNSEWPITGQTSIDIGQHHWADNNKDNVIDDDEILTVYDQYSELTDIETDIDLVEEIWMGSSYLWDKLSGNFQIVE